MNAAEVFTALCEAIWPGGRAHWRIEAMDYLGVRLSTIEDWSSGRRTFNPSVLDELEKRAKHARLTIDGALSTLELYRERVS